MALLLLLSLFLLLSNIPFASSQMIPRADAPGTGDPIADMNIAEMNSNADDPFASYGEHEGYGLEGDMEGGTSDGSSSDDPGDGAEE